MPGIAASTSETWLLGSPPNSVEAPENSFEFEVTWAWTSSPITISQSPVAPLIRADLMGAFIGGFYRDGGRWKTPKRAFERSKFSRVGKTPAVQFGIFPGVASNISVNQVP